MTNPREENLSKPASLQVVQRQSELLENLATQIGNLNAEILDIKKDQWRMEAALRQLLSRVLTLEAEWQLSSPQVGDDQ